MSYIDIIRTVREAKRTGQPFTFAFFPGIDKEAVIPVHKLTMTWIDKATLADLKRVAVF